MQSKQSITDQTRVKQSTDIPKQPKKIQTIGNYELGKTLGKGTFGKVKEGVHIPTGEKVAIKIIDKSTIEDEDDQIRIKRQVEILKKVRHPNIIYLYEIIETSECIYLITEYAEQGELFKVMTNEVRLKERAAGRIFFQIMNAVQYLHRLDIAHRDLKPENILLDNDYNVKLIDFGLSNYAESHKLLSTACGSPCYAPPEMVAGKEYDGLTGDIWSMGIIFYGMICGSLPFEEKTTKQLYKKVIEGFYVLPSDISLEAVEVIQKMLVTNPSKRVTIAQLRKLKFFRQIKAIQPQVIGIIVGFHAMPIDGEIIDKMGEYSTFTRRQVEQRLKNNQHDSLTTLYYLLQKRTLKDGNKTLNDLQVYLQTSEKYKNQYGKESLKKYRKHKFEEEIQEDQKIIKRKENYLRKKSNDRHFFSNQKLKRRVYTSQDKKINLTTTLKKRIPPTHLKTERSADERTPIKNRSKSRQMGNSPNKLTDRSTKKKNALDLWHAYFKNPLEDVKLEKGIKKKNGQSVQKIDPAVKGLKDMFMRLPNNMMKKYKMRKEIH